MDEKWISIRYACEHYSLTLTDIVFLVRNQDIYAYYKAEPFTLHDAKYQNGIAKTVSSAELYDMLTESLFYKNEFLNAIDAEYPGQRGVHAMSFASASQISRQVDENIKQDGEPKHAAQQETLTLELIERLREDGKQDSEIAAYVDQKFPRLSHSELGELLAQDGDIRSPGANKKRGQRARQRAS